MDYMTFGFESWTPRFEGVLFAMAFVIVASIIMSVFAKILKKSLSAMPVVEIILRPLFVFLIDKLNRSNRTGFALMIRGVIVFLLLSVVVFGGVMAAQYIVPYGFSDIVLLVIVLSPVMPILAGLQLSNARPVTCTYRHASVALNRNLVKVDAAGHRRNGFDLFALSLVEWCVAPIILYVLTGVGGMYLYVLVSLFCRVTGEGKESKAFLSVFYYLWVGMRFVPNAVASVIVMIASVFTPNGKPHKVLGSVLPLKAYAYAVNITLGGSYQDRHGQSIDRAWCGLDGSTAKLTPQDIVRGCFLHGFAVLMTVILCVVGYLYL